MNTIYLNIKQAEENRIIVTRNGRLIDFEQEYQGEESKKGNIYKGVVSNVEPSLEAAFVDFGDGKNGLLPLRELPANAPGVSPDGIAVGDQLLVQIKKDNIGDKGAGLTGNISLAGRFLVLRPYGQEGFGVSSAANTNERRGISEIMNSLPVPAEMGVIARSMALNHSREDILWDLESYLLPLWNAIKSTHESSSDPVLIYHENDLLLRVMRDYFRPESGDVILCDDEGRYQELRAFVQMLFPDHVEQIRHHDNAQNMLPAAIEHKIEQIYTREISAPSGVRVVFDSTEALVAVDVNSGRQRQGGNIEETALKTNIEAAEIITEQLRLRNLGGLVVIDFIDMKKRENCEALENRMAELIRRDRARTRMSRVSEFGLMELSRQRTSRSLASSQTMPCARCNGSGQVWREHSFALHLLRKARAAAFHESTHTVVLQVPREAGVFLLNEKRAELQEIETASGCSVVIVPDPHLGVPQYKIKPVKGDKKAALAAAKQMTRQEEAAEVSYKRPHLQPQAQPVLKNMLPNERMPGTPQKAKQKPKASAGGGDAAGGGLWQAIVRFFSGGESSAAAPQRGGRGRQARGGAGAGGGGNSRGASSSARAGQKPAQRRERGERGGRNARGGRDRDRGDRGENRPRERERGERAPRAAETFPPKLDASESAANNRAEGRSSAPSSAPPRRENAAGDTAAASKPPQAASTPNTASNGGAAEPAAKASNGAAPDTKPARANGGAESKPAAASAPVTEAAPRRAREETNAKVLPPVRREGGAEASKSSAAPAPKMEKVETKYEDAKPAPAAKPAAAQAKVLPPIVKPSSAPAPAAKSTPSAETTPAAKPAPAAGTGWITPGDAAPPASAGGGEQAQKAEGAAK